MKRAFIVGCARSGTTLLQSMLVAHPEIAVYAETAFFVCLMGQWHAGETSPAHRKTRRLARLMTALGIACPQARQRLKSLVKRAGRDDLRPIAARRHLTIAGYVKALISIMDRITADAGKSLWIEKSPRHIDYIDVISRYVPDAKFLHIVRNGPDTIASIYDAAMKYEVPWRRNYPDLEACISRWVTSLQITAAHMTEPNHFALTYHDLVRDPRATLSRACAFLGFPYHDAMIEDRRNVAERVVLPHEEWKRNVLGPIVNANGRKFEAIFDDEQKARIIDACSQVDMTLFSQRSPVA